MGVIWDDSQFKSEVRANTKALITRSCLEIEEDIKRSFRSGPTMQVATTASRDFKAVTRKARTNEEFNRSVGGRVSANIEARAARTRGANKLERAAFARGKDGGTPFVQTGTLRRSITYEVAVQGDVVVGRVGTNLPYGRHLELGTRGAVVVAKGKALSWIDPATGQRRFAKRVVIPPLKARPFLRPALMRFVQRSAVFT